MAALSSRVPQALPKARATARPRPIRRRSNCCMEVPPWVVKTSGGDGSGGVVPDVDAEVFAEHVGHVELAGITGELQVAVRQDVDVVGEGQGLLDVLLDDQEGAALLGQSFEEQ